MGILLMNIVAFAMPEAAYMNPRAYGGAHGFDLECRVSLVAIASQNQAIAQLEDVRVATAADDPTGLRVQARPPDRTG